MPQKTDNRSVGGRFEHDLAEQLAKDGFWVHVLQQNKAGQPADIIAVKARYATLIDCKVISNNKGFPLRRVEENQRYAMKLFSGRVGRHCWFAVKLPDGEIHMLSNSFVTYLIECGQASISDTAIRDYTYTYAKWLEEANRWA